MIFWTSARPRPVPLRLGREERTEDAITDVVRHAGTVVADADAQQAVHDIPLAFDHDLRADLGLIARLERVAAQVAHRLTQEHLVAFDASEVPAHDDVSASRPGFGTNFVRGAFGKHGHLHRCQRELGRPGKVEKIRDHLAKGLGLVADPCTYGR